MCLQWTHFNKTREKLIGAEDCLYLNVYTRSTNPEMRLPTIAFIHGGAFMFGVGSNYRPDHILNQNVVLVTFNYRLGPLGFLSTEDDVIPGNYGLKDQVTALRWIRENIQSFGGDPNTVSLVGYSAGSASVHLHYLSPLSSGLFSSGIGHSGSALNPWTMAEQSTEKAMLIGTALGCSTRETHALLDCLRKLPAEDIVRQVPRFLNFLYNPFSPFGAVVEKESFLNPHPFLTDTPRSLMKSGNIAKAPLILSVTEAEGLYPGAEFISDQTYLQQIDSQWNELLPILGLFVTFVTTAIGSSTTYVNIKNGPIIGEKRGEYYAFEGIPYAKPPLGKLRFATSEINDDRWSEPRNTTKRGPVCLQWNHLIPNKDKLEGAEDCLYLNVYTRSIDQSAQLPTVAFIHGGAFMFGTGNFYEPDHIMRRQLILVTFNYRLGPLGFLSTEDDVIPGNYGLKDQVTALRWIRENIQSFGGDPNTVSLVGYSAGSASVHLHYLSPLSSGLFSSGIGHSGSALSPWVFSERSIEKAIRIGAVLGCPTRKTQALLDCLRKVSAEDIVRQVPHFLDFLYNPFSPFGVVLERKGPLNTRPFLTDTPRSLMKSGNIAKVPLILSVTQAEGLYPGAEFISDQAYLQQIDSQWNELLPSILDYKIAIPESKQRDRLSETIRNHYFKADERLTLENFNVLVEIISNRLYFAGVTESAKLMHPFTDLYLYYDLYKSKYGVGEALSHHDEPGLLGVTHGDDVLLIFPSILREKLPYTEEEMKVVDRFVAMYESFAKGDTPRFGSDELPLQDSDNMVMFLKLNYPKSEIVRAEGISNETFWNILDFNDGPYPSAPEQMHTEL
uniref:carboxylesterase n=1 Tax=Anopheles culicifacies TaxID=139723 RepID=A0A182MH74_9DIPT